VAVSVVVALVVMDSGGVRVVEVLGIATGV